MPKAEIATDARDETLYDEQGHEDDHETWDEPHIVSHHVRVHVALKSMN